MKKIFYYALPFILSPVILSLCECIDNNINTKLISPYFLIVIFILTSFIMGNLSQTYNKFDYIITIIMPLSLFCCMFISGFLDKSDLGTRFHFSRAFKTAFQPWCLIIYCCVAISTFLSSYKKIRIKIAKLNRKKY